MKYTWENVCDLHAVYSDWSAWSEWGDCTASCGSGWRRRFRNCVNPSSAVEARPCIGVAQHTQLCNSQSCAGAMLCNVTQRNGRSKCQTPSERQTEGLMSVCLLDGVWNERTDGWRDASLRPSVRPSVRSFVSLSVVCQGRPSYGENEPPCFI